MNILDVVYPELRNIAQQIQKETGKQLRMRITSLSPRLGIPIDRHNKNLVQSTDIHSITICPKNAYDREMREHNQAIYKKHYDLFIYLDSSMVCLYSRRDPFKSKQEIEWTDPQLLDTLHKIMVDIADTQDYE